MSDSLRKTAVHEAGHFVFAMSLGYTRVSELSVVPDLTSNGRMRRQRSHFEALLEADRTNHDLHDVCTDPVVISRYRMLKGRIAHDLATISLAGAAADTELADGDGTFGEIDYIAAKNAALAILPEVKVSEFLALRVADARRLCRGPLREAITAVADQLELRGTLNQLELQRLWSEIQKSFLPRGYFTQAC